MEYTQKEVAEYLKISLRTLQYRMKKQGMKGKINEEMMRELTGRDKPLPRLKKEDVKKAKEKKEIIETKNKEITFKSFNEHIDQGMDMKVFKNNLVQAYNWNVDTIIDLKRELTEHYQKNGTTTIEYSNGTLGKHPNVELINRVEKEQRQIVKLAQELDAIDGATDAEFSFSFKPTKGDS